jgi:hypothetical protein
VYQRHFLGKYKDDGIFFLRWREYQWIAFQKFVGCELVTVVSSPASILLNGAAWAGAETFIRGEKAETASRSAWFRTMCRECRILEGLNEHINRSELWLKTLF